MKKAIETSGRKWWEEEPRKPYPHSEDEKLRSELRQVLEDLPADHPARLALASGWATIEITRHLDADRDKARIDAMMQAWYAWRERCPTPPGHSTGKLVGEKD
jgi:hypothetical protein